MRTRLFEPLGMKDTTFHPNDAQRARIARTYKMDEDTHELVPGYNPFVTSDSSVQHMPEPAGGLFSTAADMGRFYAMIASGGPKDLDKRALAVRLRKAADTGVVYYLMNDQVALSDTLLPGAAAVPGWRVVDGDIAGQALDRIGARIAEIRAGQLKLNRAGDRDFFEKQAGLTPYALDNSPLIGLFAVPDQDADNEEAEES